MNIFQPKKQLLFSLAGAGVILLALLVMLGWLLSIPALTSICPGYPTMKFNTALAFAFAGAATILVYRADKKPVQYFYHTFSAAVFLIGFLALLQYVFGTDWGIDKLLVSDRSPISPVNPYPGRMAGGTALSFCILGVVFEGLVSHRKKLRHWAQYGLHFVTVIGYVALLGYIFNVSASQNFAPFISIALHTCIIFLALSVLLAFYNPDMGLTGLFTGKGVGNEMARQLFPVLTVVTLMLGFVRVKLFARHVVSNEFGVALACSIFLLVVLLLLWRTATQLNKLEEAKLHIEEANYKLRLDIAAAKQAKRETDEINKRNLLFVEQAPSAIAMCDTDMVYMAVSQQWIKDYKLEATEVIGRLFYDVSPEIPNETKALHQRCLKGAVSKSDGKRFVWPDGREQWIAWDIRPWYDIQGKIGGLLIYTFDVTNLKKKEVLIQETTERLADAQQIAHVGSWEWDVVTRKLKWSDEHFRIFGFIPSDVQPTVEMYNSRIHPDDREMVIKSVSSALASLEIYAVEFRLILPDGSIRYIENRGKVFRNKDGKPLKMAGTGADITDRKKKEAIIQEASESLADAQQIAHVGSWDWDIAAGKMTWSDEQYRIYGFEPGQADPNEGLFYSMLYHEDKLRVIGALGDALMGKKPYATEFRLVRNDGSVHYVEARGKVLRNNDGQPVRLIGTLADISDRKNVEETRKNNAVLQSRNKEMEEFAYIASHDLQEPLRTVSSFITILNAEYGPQLQGDAQQYLQFITASTTRMRELIKGLLEYSRLGKQKTVETVDCNRLLKNVLEDLGGAIKESGAVITIDELPVIEAFATEMNQLFQNLLGNAIKFRRPDVPPLIRLSVKALPGYWQFEVSDNGVGIEHRHFHKIFILFQRLHSRRDYAGTGIGLSYCKKIVELHHGRIWVESVRGEGSNFFFTISNHHA